MPERRQSKVIELEKRDGKVVGAVIETTVLETEDPAWLPGVQDGQARLEQALAQLREQVAALTAASVAKRAPLTPEQWTAALLQGVRPPRPRRSDSEWKRRGAGRWSFRP